MTFSLSVLATGEVVNSGVPGIIAKRAVILVETVDVNAGADKVISDVEVSSGVKS